MALLSFWRLLSGLALLSFWLLLWVGLPAMTVFGLIVLGTNAVDWVRDWSEVARPPMSNDTPVGGKAPTTTGRGGEEGNDSTTEELANSCGPKKFSYAELRIATNSFATDQKLGEGGFGIVYKGHIGKDRTPVAVKKIRSGSCQGREEFICEVKSLSQLGHRHLVQLKGYCHEANKFVLVYEFMRQGSLADHLFENKPLLTWKRRYNIALGLASALHYLHKQFRRCVIHRDIKSSNVMLNKKFVAKLGDFGLAKLVGHTRGPNTTEVKGTLGYLAPEYFKTGRASKESDIYSFGVVLLEIGCGRIAVDRGRDPQNLVEWVWKKYGPKKLLHAVDERLCKNFDKKQAEALMIVGLWCTHPIESRPSIEAAMAVLNLMAKPPKLPLKMPSFNI
ncbi:L-type lectin-domain containing receptor kinase IX.1-like [Syzygium oleosum]|uniref:L-type lectin-domain containing receptor kinase IX.1-like n=1 Tax=Syzygium oleosum TaxID=219896 RepID=UPI0024BBDCED|nr:L-type lectin-domain containing receptor kinase IX.1-like [Syzygium oleosum]